MTAPAEDPRGGEAWRVTTYVAPVAHRCPWGQECPPARPTNAEDVRHDHDPEVEGCNPATCPAYRARPAGDRAQPTQEQSTDLTPGVVWADAQLAVVRDLTARAVRAEAAVGRVEALEATWRRRAVFHADHGARATAVGLTHRANDLRDALDGTT